MIKANNNNETLTITELRLMVCFDVSAATVVLQAFS